MRVKLPMSVSFRGVSPGKYTHHMVHDSNQNDAPSQADILDAPDPPGMAEARRQRRKSLIMLIISGAVLFLIIPAGEFAVLSMAEEITKDEQAKARAQGCSGNQNCFTGCGGVLFGFEGLMIGAVMAFATFPLSMIGWRSACSARRLGMRSHSVLALSLMNLFCALLVGILGIALVTVFIRIAARVG